MPTPRPRTPSAACRGWPRTNRSPPRTWPPPATTPSRPPATPRRRWSRPWRSWGSAGPPRTRRSGRRSRTGATWSSAGRRWARPPPRPRRRRRWRRTRPRCPSPASPPPSRLRSRSPETLTLDDALQLLSLPRRVGVDQNGVEIFAAAGRYGPYIKRGDDTRSLESEEQLFTITVEEALALLAAPKTRGRRTP